MLRGTVAIVVTLGLAVALPALAQDGDLCGTSGEPDAHRGVNADELAELEKSVRDRILRDRAECDALGIRTAFAVDAFGRRVAAVGPGNRLEVWTDGDPAADVLVPGGPSQVLRLVFHPREPLVYAITEDWRICEIDLAEATSRHVFGTGGDPAPRGYVDIDVAPDGTRVLLVGQLRTPSAVVDAVTGKNLGLPLTVAGDESEMAFLADSRRALIRRDGALELHDLGEISARSRNPAPVWSVAGGFGARHATETPAELPLGDEMFDATALDKLRLVVTVSWMASAPKRRFVAGWDLRTGASRFRLDLPPGESRRVLPARSATRVLLMSSDGTAEGARTVFAHSAETGRLLEKREFSSGTPQPRGVSPDGKTGFDVDKDGRLIRFELFPKDDE